MEQKKFLSPLVKTMLIITIILLTGILLIAIGNPFKKLSAPTLTPVPRINAIEISADAKSILSAETKKAVFTIEEADKYLKDSGYAYNSDTFQDTNAKYAGDCFLAATLSNNKDRIVFSTGCLAGDLPQPWIGVYKIPYKGYDNNLIVLAEIKFSIGGDGRNFIWSSDDKTIVYEADLGLSGMTETRMIDSATGEILERKGKDEIDTSDWQTYRNEEYGFEVKYPNDWAVSDDSSVLLSLKSTQEKISSTQSFFVIKIKKNHEINSEISGVIMEKISTGNYQGYKYFYQEGAGTSEVVLIQLGKDALELSLDYFASSGSNFNDTKIAIQKIINPILSTFKFIEKDETSAWEKYRSERYGFEIKFPKTWQDYDVFPSSGRETYYFDKKYKYYSVVFEHPQRIGSDGIIKLRKDGVSITRFTIGIFDKNNWQIVQESQSRDWWKILTEADEHIYAVRIKAIDVMKEKPAGEIDSILKTFKTFEFEKFDNIDEWETYVNEKYLYSFKYPSYTDVGDGMEKTEVASEVWTIAPSLDTPFIYPHFGVEVIEKNNNGTVLELKEFVDNIWRLNKKEEDYPDPPLRKKGEVGEIVQTTVNGEKAYQFTLAESYSTENRGGTLSEEYLFVFTAKNGKIIRIWFPTSDKQSNKILETFKFIEK